MPCIHETTGTAAVAIQWRVPARIRRAPNRMAIASKSSHGGHLFPFPLTGSLVDTLDSTAHANFACA